MGYKIRKKYNKKLDARKTKFKTKWLYKKPTNFVGRKLILKRKNFIFVK